MRFIFAIILTMLIGCSMVPKAEYTQLNIKHDECTKELEKWKPTSVEIKEKELAKKTIDSTIKIFLQEFGQYLAEHMGQPVDLRGDELTFVDGYHGAIIRLWVKSSNELANCIC